MLASPRAALLALLLVWLPLASVRSEEQPAVSDAQLKQCIGQLNDDDIQVRESAEAHLRAAGRAALPFFRTVLADGRLPLEAKIRLQHVAEELSLWDGRESVADYAKFVGVKPTEALDPGRGGTLELVLIPAGKFMMGSPDTEKDRFANEGPQHEVTISKPFYMGKFDVTQEQYEAVMGNNPSHFKGPKNPVERVSWDDAQEFCKKLSAKTGKTVRLPAEAEWEYACRAGTKTRFYSGDADDDLEGVAWYSKNSDSRTHPVGQKKPNAWGLYDMHGNVWQWCQDWYGSYQAGAAVDAQGVAQGADRVFRGGSWGYALGSCRAAIRPGCNPDLRDDNFGFRVVAVAPRTP